jgi:hypothetical protein
VPDKTPTKKAQAWPLFDAIVNRAPMKGVNPWQRDGTFAPDYDTLCGLLGVPLSLNAGTQTGVPALALDVWVAYELRRAEIEPDLVWPRAQAPRVVSRDVLNFIASIPNPTRQELLGRLVKGTNNKTTGMSANLLGKNYTKQVDVVISGWETGPEVLISTKRMDSSFGNNAANRIEESYGDAKNLRLRYPQAACGFVFGIRSTAWDKKPANAEDAGIAERLVDLLGKLGTEPDAYHATALVVMEYAGAEPVESNIEEAGNDGAEEEEAGIAEQSELAEIVDLDVDAELAALPEVKMRRELVPSNVDPSRFFTIMLDTVLTNTPVAYHRAARRLRSAGTSV